MTTTRRTDELRTNTGHAAKNVDRGLFFAEKVRWEVRFQKMLQGGGKWPAVSYCEKW